MKNRISDIMCISDVGNGQITIEVDGIIGYPANWQHEDAENIATTKKEMKKELKALNSLDNSIDTIILNIDSPGGSVDHALSMFHALNSNSAKKIVNYTGNSASAATILASVADKDNISMPEYMTILVHEARYGLNFGGTADTLENDAKDLRKINNQLAKIYSNLNGKSIKDNLAIMAENGGEGRLMTAEEAKEDGFIGKIIKINKRAAALDYNKFAVNGYADIHINKLKSITNIKKSKPMSLLDKVFGNSKENDIKLLPGKVDGQDIVYPSDIKIGDEIVAIGEDPNVVNGILKTKNSEISIVENVVTSIEEVSAKDAEILALNNKVSELEDKYNELSDEIVETITALKKEVDANANALKNAKLNISSPKLPEKEFQEETNTPTISALEKAKQRNKNRMLNESSGGKE